MSYFPIVISSVGSPATVIDPFVNGYFTVSGNQTAVFKVATGSPENEPATKFIAYDDNTPSSKIYPYDYPGSPPVTNFEVASVFYNGENTEITPVETIQDISPAVYKQLVDSTYVVPYSDRDKSPIVIPALESNSEFSIVLPARAVLDYGEIIDTNFLQLLENFAGPVAPGGIGSPFEKAPVEGQLWFDTSGSPPQNLIRVWNADSMTWESFQGAGMEEDFILGSAAAGSPSVITTTNVNVQPRSGGRAFQQVFLNGVLQREDDSVFTNNGNYYVTGIGGNIVFAFALAGTDEILIYAL
jgi:hypothetical protein